MENMKYIIASKDEIRPNIIGFCDPIEAISEAKQTANTTGKTQVILCFIRDVVPTVNHSEKPILL